MHGDIGYKFCWLLPSKDRNQGTPAGHESNGTVVGDHWEDMNQLIHQLGTNQAITGFNLIDQVKISSYCLVFSPVGLCCEFGFVKNERKYHNLYI